MTKKMMTKILTALVLIAIVVPPILLGGYFMIALVAVVAFLAAYEIASMIDQKPHWCVTLLNFAAIILMYIISARSVGAVEAIWLFVLFVIELFDRNFTTDRVVYTFALTSLVGMAIRCVATIYSNEAFGPLLLLFVLIACYVCDTGAYFFGVFFGKHKMIPRISPNKTWEGAVGGYVSGLVISLIYGLVFVHSVPTGLIISGSLLLPFAAQIGDLSFSSVKRRFQIKDFGNFLPGHGGILDRIDSLIFCLMAFNALMIMAGVTI